MHVGVVVVAKVKGGSDDTSSAGIVGVYPFTYTRRVGGRRRLRANTVCLGVRILGGYFGLCGAGARQLSNSIEEPVNFDRAAAGTRPNILGVGMSISSR